MPLVKSILASALKEAFMQNLTQGDADSQSLQAAKQAAETMANNLATAIDNYLKSATVIGVAPSGGGPITGGAIQ